MKVGDLVTLKSEHIGMTVTKVTSKDTGTLTPESIITVVWLNPCTGAIEEASLPEPCFDLLPAQGDH